MARESETLKALAFPIIALTYGLLFVWWLISKPKSEVNPYVH